MRFSIRPIRTDDRADWGGLYAAYQAFYRRDPDADFYDAAFARLTGGDFHGLVAEGPDGLLGLAHYTFHGNLWRPEGVCYLQDLFTAPPARGQGVGGALIRAVYAAADTAGVPSVYWLTAEDNYAGRMLYDRVGLKSPFIRYNRPPQEARP